MEAEAREGDEPSAAAGADLGEFLPEFPDEALVTAMEKPAVWASAAAFLFAALGLLATCFGSL